MHRTNTRTSNGRKKGSEAIRGLLVQVGRTTWMIAREPRMSFL